MGLGAAVDASGNMYVTGRTESSNYPTTPNAVSRGYRGGVSDAFASKFGAGGDLIYSTYLGGAREDEGRGIGVDSAGNVYVAGFTDSADFPTVNAAHPSVNSGQDAFIVKIGPVGALAWSTYLGGGGDDRALALAVDSA